MAKYKEARAAIRGHENWTIQDTKSYIPVSLSQASTSTAGSLSGKQSKTPPRWNSEGRDHRQRNYHLAHHFLIRPPMLRPWGPPPMMHPPWAGWYGPWTPPPMHFHPGWWEPAEGFGHGGYYAEDGHYGSVDHQQDRRALKLENRMIRNPKPDGSVSSKTATAPSKDVTWSTLTWLVTIILLSDD
jgi:hypothetical protein